MRARKLSEVCQIIMGQSPKGSSYNQNQVGMPLLNGAADYKGQNFTPNQYTSEPTRIAKQGDIIFGVRATIGNFAIVDKDYCIGRGVSAIRVNEELVLKEYIIRFVKKEIEKLKNKASGSTIKGIKKEDLTKMKINLPPLETQKQIAQILDNAAALRDKTKQLLTEYDALAQSIFLDMFGDPVVNPKEWETKTIEKLVLKEKGSIKRGPFGGALKKEIFVNEGYLVYEQYHALNNDFDFERYYIDDNHFKKLKGFEVKPGDIIISCSGVYLGKLAIIPENAKKGIINQALLKITLDECKMRKEFFVFHFTQENFRIKYFDANRGAGIPNFPPMSSFKKFPFVIPPIEVQNEFVEKLKLIEQQKELAKQELKESEDLFNCLLQKAFKGELV
ncbi:restriction endonuclease subunit S [Yeosuana marina]|uniref:restriction endonuclease subunit S n=1 Tax=Yeosuana marina TaxID=1565536 RepID=UPI0030EF8329|tara:strand:- start:7119 stop:8288 length:1170 start_codon:yes stop_codon:yes gene_type:complete